MSAQRSRRLAVLAPSSVAKLSTHVGVSSSRPQMTGAKLRFFRAAMNTNEINTRTVFVSSLCRAACVDPRSLGHLLSCGTLFPAPGPAVAETHGKQTKTKTIVHTRVNANIPIPGLSHFNLPPKCPPSTTLLSLATHSPTSPSVRTGPREKPVSSLCSLSSLLSPSV